MRHSNEYFKSRANEMEIEPINKNYVHRINQQ